MNDVRYTTLPQWPHAFPASGASATLKRLNEDFVVTERRLQLPCSEGEHLWLDVEKSGGNTAFVAQRLAAGRPRVSALQVAIEILVRTDCLEIDEAHVVVD